MKPLAGILHDSAHRGWHEWSPDGKACPDGKQDADAWVVKADLLQRQLADEGVFLVDAESLAAALHEQLPPGVLEQYRDPAAFCRAIANAILAALKVQP